MRSRIAKYLSVLALALPMICAAPFSVTATTITVDALHPGLAIQREMYGHNVSWYTLDKQYLGDYAIAPSLLTDYRNMGVGSLRYPGGCMADTFAWETSIGPFGQRAIQYLNGKPAVAKFPSSFGADEYLRLCEQLGAEPQIILQFRAPDINTKNQAESTYSIVTNKSGLVGVTNCALDDGSSVIFPAKGDAIKLTFSISRDGYYKLALRNRAGHSTDTTFYWRTNAYTYLLDSSTLAFTNDNSTVSAVDSSDAQTTWGTTRSGVVYLRYGSHTLTITAQDTWLRADYLEVQELNHDNSVKRATAWIAYCNADPSDARSIGVDAAGVDWGTVGSWAQKRVANGHPEPYAVKYWEVGNEAWGPDPYGSPPGRDPVPYNNGWIDYYNSARSVDINLRLSLSGYSPSTWTNTLIQTHGGKASYIHFHPYYPNDKSTTDPYTLYLEGISSFRAVQNYIDSYRGTINTYWPSRAGKIKGSASEWSACYGWSEWDHSSWSARMSAVLTVADQLGTMTRNTDLMESTQFWASYAPNSYTIFTEDWGATSYYKQGIYEAFRHFGNYFGDRVLPVTVSADCPTYHFNGFGSVPAGDYPMLSAYASQDSANYYLVVINKDTVNARTASLTWQGLPDCTNRVQVRTISSSDPLPNYSSVNTGAAAPIRTLTSNLTPYRASSTYDFPACSVTGFVIEKAKPANLVWHREAEDMFTAYTDTPPYPTIVAEGPWNYDTGGHVRMVNAGDSIVIPFNIRKKGPYAIRLRGRSGYTGASRYFWDNNGYSYYIDGSPVTFAGLPLTISPLDNGAYWGTVELTGRSFEYGRHYLKIKTNIAYGLMVDWIEVERQQYAGNEAESGYSVVTNSSGTVGVANLGLDGSNHVRMGMGDVVDVALDIPRSSFYDTCVRIRSGNASGSTNLLSAYSWSIDGSAAAATPDTATTSALDSDGATYWMTVKLTKKFLAAGRHTVRVFYNSPTAGRIDYVTASAASSGVIIAGPTIDSIYVTDSATFPLSAIGSDDVTKMTWSNARGGSGTYNGVTALNVDVPLQMGGNPITVTATDSAGAILTDAISVIRIVGGKQVSDIRKLSNGSLSDLVSKVVTGVFSDCFFIEDADRSAGIKVRVSPLPTGIAIGSIATIHGWLSVSPEGERYVYGMASIAP